MKIDYSLLKTAGVRQHDIAKHGFLKEWIEAVNHQVGFGMWHSAVSTNPADVAGIINEVIQGHE